jgi:hypothetical protein
MAHKIRTSKKIYDDGYRPNKVLLALLAIGYPCIIIYMSGYFYNIYEIFFVDHFGENITFPSETIAILMGITVLTYLIIEILSTIMIVSDAKKLNVGLAYEKERFFKSITWHIHSWGILTFFFWWFIFPLYLYHRKEIYRINKEAYISYMANPPQAGGY